MAWNNNNRYQNSNSNNGGMPLGTVQNGKVLTKNGWQEYKKKSGAKGGKAKNDKWYVSAWNASKTRGLIKFSAFENKRSEWYDREDGSKAVSMLFEVFYSRTGNKVLELGFYNITTGKVVLPKTGFIISTKSPNGGFCGIFKKK